MCVRCTVDVTVPGHDFDRTGVCNYCRLHDKLARRYPLDARGRARQQKIIRRIRAQGRSRPYDCIVGTSGGRDSTYTLYLAKRVWGLRPLAVHFNDGFGNPVAGENMSRAASALGVELRTVTSDWRESKDLRISYLKASTPDLGTPTDIGIANALYSTALKENIRYIIIGQSFRTEGIAPLQWNYLDGRYLKSVWQQFGRHPLRPWKPLDPGFNLLFRHLFYYTVLKRIRTVPLLYYENYIRRDAEAIIERELSWRYPGAHYYDDLYQSLMTYVMRTKFGIDRRKYNYAALVRSKQMTKQEALRRLEEVYVIEDPKVIDLCIKRLGMTREAFEACVSLTPRTFRDYRTSYDLIRLLRWPIKVLAMLNVIPSVSYDKYFNCG